MCDLLHPLCGSLQAPCGLLQPLCMLYMRYVGCYRHRVGCKVAMWAVATSMWAVTASMWAVQWRNTKTEKNSNGADSVVAKGKNIRSIPRSEVSAGIWLYPEVSGVSSQTKSIIYVESRVYSLSSNNLCGVDGLHPFE